MKNYFTSIIAFGFVTIFFIGCQKKTDCQANIICNDAQGKPMSNVEVRLFANVKTGTPPVTRTGDVKASGTTDQNGKVSFIFKLPAIFDVTASVGTTTATTLIKLEEGKTTDKVLEIK
ncbi:MAG: hypothetical protein H0U95_04770 [Bacteroidetes bacterium]|nr:hypothetical protein [Bacteroidota bacterium]